MTIPLNPDRPGGPTPSAPPAPAPGAAPRIRFTGGSDVGRRRTENQDRWLVLDHLSLAAVADGMGGLSFGDQAAQLALDELRARLAPGLPADGEAWGSLFDAINAEVSALGARISPNRGIGSTLTVAAVTGARLVIAHVGDSAVFRFRDGKLEQLNAEHTLAAAMRARGETPVPPSASHALTSCLGLPRLPQKQVLGTDLRRGDRLLLCSDGLTKPVAEATIAATLAAAAAPEQTVQNLIALANQAGGPDNITVVLGVVE